MLHGASYRWDWYNSWQSCNTGASFYLALLLMQSNTGCFVPVAVRFDGDPGNNFMRYSSEVRSMPGPCLWNFADGTSQREFHDPSRYQLNLEISLLGDGYSLLDAIQLR